MTNENRVRKGVPTGGEFAAHNRSEGDVSLGGSKYVHMDPPEIDEELGMLSGRAYQHRMDLHGEQEFLKDYEKWLKLDENRQRNNKWRYSPDRIAAAEKRAEEHEEAIAELNDLMAPIEAEFKRRGGWTRFFLVQNSGGHVHSSMHCSSCSWKTSFGWLTEYSGQDEPGIVEKAGDGACTICFPSAPVADKNNPRPNKLELPEQKALREERERAKAEREAKRLRTGIWNPDGSELREAQPQGSKYRGQLIKTERAAEIHAVDYVMDRAFWAGRLEELERDGVLTEAAKEHEHAKEKTFDAIVAALAAKRGESEEDIRALVEKKAAAKKKRNQY